MGGVVNIVTPEPSGPLSTIIDVEGGSFQTAQAAAQAQAGNDKYGWRVGASYLTSDGISSYNEELGGDEEDGYRNVGFNARGILHISDAIDAELRTTYSEGRTEFDGFPPPSFSFADTREYGYTTEWVGYAGVKIDTLAERLQHRIGIAYTDTDRENFDPDSTVPLTFDATGKNLRYEYQGTFTVNDRVSGVFGAERERSELSTVSPSEFDPNPTPLDGDVTLDSVYGQLQFSPIRALTLSGGLRYDDHETFGDDTSSQLAVAWSASDSTLLRASYGEGFKAPTLYQLYSQYGTPSLEPEESDDWDIGIEQRLLDERLLVSATYFERDTDNMIAFVSCFGVTSARCTAQPDGYYDNVQRAHVDGYELGLSALLAPRLRFTANYTGLDARNDSAGTANFGNELPRRPSDSAAAQLSYEWSVPLTTTLAAQYVGRSFDNAGNTFELEEYTLVDIRASYRWSQTVEVYGRVENLLDEQYETIRRYGTPGRAAYVGVRVTM
ncbi:MAG: TonB-dependent receptor [Steroidobacteraceae bacterium]